VDNLVHEQLLTSNPLFSTPQQPFTTSFKKLKMFKIAVCIESKQWKTAFSHKVLKGLSNEVVTKTLEATQTKGNYAVCVVFVNDAAIQDLNKTYRGMDKPTNVLSFIDGALEGKTTQLGDIFLSFETCHREATAQNKKFNDHVIHLLVHGVLHLLGYDHETDADAAQMEQLEIDILAGLFIANPYQQAE
jgi:probable rRNA maturation factor